ncbi:MAG: hypothetical protein HYT93_05230 [Parcubacteria group bacterium]|nr:hypothetical protein [Parcubacteria group bacterium]
MKTRICAFLVALLLGGAAHADEHLNHLKDTWIERNGSLLSMEYGLNIDFLGERWNVFCKRSRMHPKVGVVMRPVADLCAIEDKNSVAHISIYAENQSFYGKDAEVVKPDPQNPLSFHYAELHPWKDLMADQFLSHTAKSVGATLVPNRSRSRGEFRVERFRAESGCEGVPESRLYKLRVEGIVVDERGEESPIRHESYVAFGFFPHLVEYDFVGEMGRLSEPVLRKLYFTVVIYNDPNVTADITAEACGIIQKIASQARRN